MPIILVQSINICTVCNTKSMIRASLKIMVRRRKMEKFITE